MAVTKASGDRDLGWSHTPEKKWLQQPAAGVVDDKKTALKVSCVWARGETKIWLGTTLHVRFDVLVFTGNA